MALDIKESDWKRFRHFHPIALERFCERTLKDIAPIVSQEGPNWHERYLAVHKVLVARDRELANAFNDLRRSTALTQLRLICSLGLLTEEEIEQFSPEAQGWARG